MKKIALFIITFLVIAIIGFIGYKYMNGLIKKWFPEEKIITALKVEDGKLKDQDGDVVVLKGISSHGYQWFPELLTENNFKYLKDNFKINTFRISVYANDELDYNNLKYGIYNAIDSLVELNMYVVIDWHVLNPGNPNDLKDKAIEFFNDISVKYSNTPNIIYEICNEPNGNKVNWDECIKPYAEEIIPVIRNNAKDAVIVVGTPTYSKRIDKAIENPLEFDNIMYSVHFYAGKDKDYLRGKIKDAIDKNYAVLVSEWGTTDETGNGEIYPEECENWINFLNENQIGYINWSLCNKDESSAILKPEYDVKNEEIKIDDYLTESGKLVKELYTK